TLKILPLPGVRIRRMLVQFADWPTAGEAIKGLRKARVVPDLLEFLDRETIAAVNRSFDFHVEEAEATLLVDLEEPSIPAATEVFRVHHALGIRPAADEAEADRLYQVRARAYLALKERASGIQIEDVVVFRAQLEAHGGGESLRLMKEIKRVFDPKGIMNPGKYVDAA